MGRHAPMSFALAICLLAGSSVPVTAQSEPEEPVVQPAQGALITPAAGINADTVDRKHAVGFTNDTTRRAKKLVATNKVGLLPANIVRPLWTLVQDIPPGFADGTDDEGVTGVSVTTVSGSTTVHAGPGAYKQVSAQCPDGSLLTGGGFAQAYNTLIIRDSQPYENGWYVEVENPDADDYYTIHAFAVCLSIQPSGPVTATATKDTRSLKVSKRKAQRRDR
jgi:hypothetical protein